MTLVRCTHAHLCREWDFMRIKLGSTEFEACICKCEEGEECQQPQVFSDKD